MPWISWLGSCRPEIPAASGSWAFGLGNAGLVFPRGAAPFAILAINLDARRLMRQKRSRRHATGARRATRSDTTFLADVGEWGLLARLASCLPEEPSWVVIGRGVDDAAALDLGGRELVLLTCDLQLEGRHFRRDWIAPRLLGRRAAAVNLSDIAAMGGRPRAAVASLALPRSLDVRYFDALMRGLGDQLAEHGAALVGGNLAESARHVAVDVTLLGTVDRKRVARRKGARPGDRILLTGWLGESAAGFALLRRQPGARGGARPTGLVRRHLDPTPRVREGAALAAHGVTAMIDISDGLDSDLVHLCEASQVGAEIDLALLPASGALVRAASSLHAPAWKWMLRGGEDYELLCTAPPTRVPALRKALARVSDLPLTDLGVILPADEGHWVVRAGKRVRLTGSGFQHFGGKPLGR
jgi:thiamine-monophosphate kinase